MRITLVILLLYCAVLFTAAEEETRDLEIDDGDSEDLERKHRKRKKHGGQSGPCGYGGFGKTFGSHDTYVSAPVMNYFLCGVAPVPVVPQFQPYPLQGGHGHGGHGHGGHGHGGHGHGGHGHGGHGHGSHGGHGGNGGYGGYGGHGGYGGYGGYGGNGDYGGYGGFGGNGGQGFYPQSGYPQNGFNQYPGQFNRPFQNAVSAAASGFGNILADYITRPRKTQRQINQFLRPIYKLF